MSTSLVARCPSCHMTVSAPAALAGHSTRCGQCGENYTLPEFEPDRARGSRGVPTGGGSRAPAIAMLLVGLALGGAGGAAAIYFAMAKSTEPVAAAAQEADIRRANETTKVSDKNPKSEGSRAVIPNGAIVTPLQLQHEFQSIRRNQLVKMEEESLAEAQSMIAKVTGTSLKEIGRWQDGDLTFRSGNPVLALYLNARAEAGYSKYVRRKCLEFGLNSPEYFMIVLNGYKRYPGLMTKDDLIAKAILFGGSFPQVQQLDIVFSVRDDVLHCDEDSDNRLQNTIQSVYRIKVTTEPYLPKK